MNSTLPFPAPLPLEDQIREAAYFQWLDRGCPTGDDWSNWFTAEKQLQLESALAIVPPTHNGPARSVQPPSKHGPGESLSHLHATAGHDHRPEILAGGAAQRTRSRHSIGKAARSPSN